MVSRHCCREAGNGSRGDPRPEFDTHSNHPDHQRRHAMSLQRTLFPMQTLRNAAATIGLSLAASVTAFADDAKTQYFPLATFRVGAYASSGIPVWAGEIDYFRYINEVEGGINGIKLVWDE